MDIANQLSTSGRAVFTSRLVHKKFDPSQPVLDKGSSVSGAYFVLEGALRVFTLSPQGKQITLYRILPGQTCILAINSLFNSFLYPAWVEAEEKTVLGVLPGDIYRQLFRGEAIVQDITIKALSSTVFGLMSALEKHHSQTIKQRLAHYLLVRVAPDATVYTTQQVIADDLGSTREFVARILSHLTQQGLVQTGRGKIRILDPEALKKLCQCDEA